MIRIIIIILCLWAGAALAQSIGGNFGALQGRVTASGGGGGGGGGGGCNGVIDASAGCPLPMLGM